MSRSHRNSRPTLCPPVEFEESVLGLTWRTICANGAKRVKGVADYLVERRTLQPPWIVPANLTLLCKRLSPVFQSVDEIVRNHTCLPALVPFVPQKHIASLLDHVISGQHIRGIAAVAGMSGKFAISRSVMAMCPQCVKSDLERLGFAYWRREHMVPGLGYCPHHGLPLVAGCGACQYSHTNNRRARLPQLLCWCGQPHCLSHSPVNDEDGALLTRMARTALLILRGALSGATPELVGAYYHMRAHELGYAKKTYLAPEQIQRDIQRSYSPAVLERLNASIGVGRSWAAVALGKRVAPIILGRNLLLLDFFGGKVPTPDDLKRADDHVGSLDTRRDQGRTRRVEDFDEGKRDEVREALLAFQNDYPGAGRTSLIRTLGRTAIWARDNDAAWYESTFPSRRRGLLPQPEDVRNAARKAFDERTAIHIFKNQIRLLSGGGTPKKLTKSLLLKGTPRGNMVSNAKLRELPLTREALELCVDGDAQFMTRRALWLLDTLPNTDDRLHEVRRVTGLSLYVIDRLNLMPRLRRRRV